MAKTFTFKDNQPTGKWRSFEQLQIDIKFGGKICGSIHEISSSEWMIKFMVKRDPSEVTKQSPCPWKWFTLKHRGTSKQDAKAWLKERTESIMNQLDLHMED